MKNIILILIVLITCSTYLFAGNIEQDTVFNGDRFFQNGLSGRWPMIDNENFGYDVFDMINGTIHLFTRWEDPNALNLIHAQYIQLHHKEDGNFEGKYEEVVYTDDGSFICTFGDKADLKINDDATFSLSLKYPEQEEGNEPFKICTAKKKQTAPIGFFNKAIVDLIQKQNSVQ